MSAQTAARKILNDIRYRDDLGHAADRMPEHLRRDMLENWAEIIERESRDAIDYFHQQATWK